MGKGRAKDEKKTQRENKERENISGGRKMP
jgi:hypothetical protein